MVENISAVLGGEGGGGAEINSWNCFIRKGQSHDEFFHVIISYKHQSPCKRYKHCKAESTCLLGTFELDFMEPNGVWEFAKISLNLAIQLPLSLPSP